MGSAEQYSHICDIVASLLDSRERMMAISSSVSSLMVSISNFFGGGVRLVASLPGTPLRTGNPLIPDLVGFLSTASRVAPT